MPHCTPSPSPPIEATINCSHHWEDITAHEDFSRRVYVILCLYCGLQREEPMLDWSADLDSSMTVEV